MNEDMKKQQMRRVMKELGIMSEAKWLTLAYALAMVVLVLDIFYWRAV